jgi:hypothetical protein
LPRAGLTVAVSPRTSAPAKNPGELRMNISSLLASLFLIIASNSVYATSVNGTPLSEPGMLELLAIAAVAAIVVALRKRKK